VELRKQKDYMENRPISNSAIGMNWEDPEGVLGRTHPPERGKTHFLRRASVTPGMGGGPSSLRKKMGRARTLATHSRNFQIPRLPARKGDKDHLRKKFHEETAATKFREETEGGELY